MFNSDIFFRQLEGKQHFYQSRVANQNNRRRRAKSVAVNQFKVKSNSVFPEEHAKITVTQQNSEGLPIVAEQ